MFGTLKTLFTGASARSEDRLRDAYALELIDQKIREVELSVKAAKATLASLIQRQRSEARQIETLEARINTLTQRARAALDADQTDLANEAANAIATMENELVLRRETTARLDQKTLRLRASVETGHRRVIDLKQGAISARAVRREQDIQMQMNSATNGPSAVEEAEDLIARVLGRDDPFEKVEIIREINQELSHDALDDRMADAGFGPTTKTTAKDVLARLNTETV